jgi:hypothetical protein
MNGEIDRDWYCVTAYMINQNVECHGYANEICDGCIFRHRKWPTPEQFEEEYGWKLSKDFPVWLLIADDPSDSFLEWTLMIYADALQYERESEEADYAPAVHIICACTPWGCPPDDWRP